MLLNIVCYLMEFGVQTVFLTAALWIMIKLQKLDYNFPGLLGSAAIACGADGILNLILGRWFGVLSVYFSAPVFLVVLFVCIKKLTNADMVDVIFTLCVGGALRFGMNLWLIGMLMGNLRPLAAAPEEFETSAPPQNQPVLQTTEVDRTTARTNRAVRGTPAGLPPQPKAAKPVDASAALFSVKGVSRNGSQSNVTIQTGRRTYTISLGEAALTQTSNGPVSVRFKELGDGWVLLVINGQETKLPLPQAAP